MLNKKEKEIMNDHVLPIVKKWISNSWNIDLIHKEFSEISNELKDDLKTVKNWLNAIDSEKYAKISIHGVVKRYSKVIK